MRYAALLLPALALLLGARPYDRLGLGIAIVEVADGVRIELLASPDAAAPVAFLAVEADSLDHTFRLTPDSDDGLRPEMLALDYGLLTFRVLTVTDAAYEVVVDEESSRTLWLRRQPAVAFKPWARFLVEHVTGFSRLDPETNPVRTAPDPGAAVVPYGGHEEQGWDCLAVAEVRGEWARVRLSDLCDYGGAEPVDGWVRWRDREALLITYGMTC